MAESRRIARRSFLARAAAAAFPAIIPAAARGAGGFVAPGNRITLGFIGTGNHGVNMNLKTFLQQPDAQVVALCDVDAGRVRAAQELVAQHYAQQQPGGTGRACDITGDWREIIARPDVDAVVVSTPDHWHVLPSVMAARAGKDVFCEKPLTHNIHEAITVMAAVKRRQRVLQTGSMQRSMSEFRVACELVRNGVIGKLQRVTCKVGDPAKPCDLPEEPMEPGLDWDRWLGPAPQRPYNSILCPRGVHDGYPNWRAYREYGGGGICDFGAHHFDIAQWGLGMDESGPVEVRPPENPEAVRGAVLVYEGGVTVTQTAGEGQRWGGLRFYGTDGEIEADRGNFELVRGNERMIQWARAEKEYLTDAKIRLYHSPSHTDDFLARLVDRKRPVASEIEGGHTAILCHLVNLAYYHRQTIKWNPHKLAFADASCDPAWLTSPYRDPWKV